MSIVSITYRHGDRTAMIRRIDERVWHVDLYRWSGVFVRQQTCKTLTSAQGVAKVMGVEVKDAAARTFAMDRVVECPECHRTCGWCAWYVKNAREAGCGLFKRKPKSTRCPFDALKGTTCALCGGTEKVRLVGEYQRLDTL